MTNFEDEIDIFLYVKEYQIKIFLKRKDNLMLRKLEQINYLIIENNKKIQFFSKRFLKLI